MRLDSQALFLLVSVSKPSGLVKLGITPLGLLLEDISLKKAQATLGFVSIFSTRKSSFSVTDSPSAKVTWLQACAYAS